MLGIVIWHLWAHRNYRTFLPAFAVGGIATTLLQLPIDYWGYGRFTLPIVGYVRMNLLEGVAAKFSTLPWWTYFYLPVGNVFIVSAIIAFAASIVLWVRLPRHPLTWTMLPGLLFHMAIAHKEERFVFPLAMFAAVAITVALTDGATPEGYFTRQFAWLSKMYSTRAARALWLVALLPALVCMLYPFHWYQQYPRARAEYEQLPLDANLYLNGAGPSYYPIFRKARTEYLWDSRTCCLHKGDYYLTMDEMLPPAAATRIWFELPRWVPATWAAAVREKSVVFAAQHGEPFHQVAWSTLYRIDAGQAGCAAVPTCERAPYVPIGQHP
jgi:hypothetical protein